MGYGNWDSISYTTYANSTGRSVNSAGNLSSNYDLRYGYFDWNSIYRRIDAIIIAILIFVVVLVTLWNLFIGNRQILDTSMRFDHAMIKLADGEIVEGRVDSWMDFENSDQIQVTINGTTYLVHSTNATLIKN